LNEELIKRIQKAEGIEKSLHILPQLNGEREQGQEQAQNQAIEGSEESNRTGDGLYVERGGSDPEEQR
jgi:hypothetical protein